MIILCRDAGGREMSQNFRGNLNPLPRGFRTWEYHHCVTNQILQISRKIWPGSAMTEGKLPPFSNTTSLTPQLHLPLTVTSIWRKSFFNFNVKIWFFIPQKIFTISHTQHSEISNFKFNIQQFVMHCGPIWELSHHTKKLLPFFAPFWLICGLFWLSSLLAATAAL